MVCCVVATLVVGVFYRLFPWRRTDTDAGFAPAVRRPATEVRVFRRHDDSALRELPMLPRRQAIAAWTLRLGTIGAGLYLMISAAMVALGLAHDVGSPSSWLTRSVVVVVVAAASAGLGRMLSARGLDPLTRVQVAGCGLLAAGIVFLELMVVDMHVLGLYHLPSTLAHLMFQAACVLSAWTGVVLLGGLSYAAPRPTTLLGGRS